VQIGKPAYVAPDSLCELFLKGPFMKNVFIAAACLMLPLASPAYILKGSQSLAKIESLQGEGKFPTDRVKVVFTRHCSQAVVKPLVAQQRAVGKLYVQVGIVLQKNNKACNMMDPVESQETRYVRIPSDLPVVLTPLEEEFDLLHFNGSSVDNFL
jgi:hypothetical protein